MTPTKLNERISTLTRLLSNNSIFLENNEKNEVIISDIPEATLNEVCANRNVMVFAPMPESGVKYPYAMMNTKWGKIELRGEIINTSIDQNTPR